MFVPPHSPAIFSQQSLSASVSIGSGKKHASWGRNPQATTIANTNARNDHDIRQRVYIEGGGKGTRATLLALVSNHKDTKTQRKRANKSFVNARFLCVFVSL